MTIKQLAQKSIETESYEEAFRLFSKVLESDLKDAEAWIGRGISAAYQSTLANPRVREASLSVKEAKQIDPDVSIAPILDALNDFSTHAMNHMISFQEIDSWYDWAQTSELIINCLDTILEQYLSQEDRSQSLCLYLDVLEFSLTNRPAFSDSSTLQQRKRMIISQIKEIDPKYEEKISYETEIAVAIFLTIILIMGFAIC